MGWGLAAVVGGAIVGGLLSSRSSGRAAQAQEEAAEISGEAQVEAARLAIEEQRRQFEAVQRILAPYVGAGAGAVGGQQALLGLRGPREQEIAIKAIERSPQFQTLVQQGEEALLQNAAATGGVRGGNLQGALAQYRPRILSQLIESQFSKLGALSGLGQASAAGQAAAGQQTAGSIANLLGQQGLARSQAALMGGQAQAGSALAQGQAWGQTANTLGTLGLLSALGAF